MDIANIPIFAMLRARMGYLSDRQRVIAQNVANANTPGFSPSELKPFSFSVKSQLAQPGGSVAGSGPAGGSDMAVTQPGHLQPPGSQGPGGAKVATKKIKDSETTLDGNSVVLEEEMMKLTESRMDYDAAVGFYQKSLDILKLAARRPGSA
jgi:flagellar basal-body rod protein FlgB